MARSPRLSRGKSTRKQGRADSRAQPATTRTRSSRTSRREEEVVVRRRYVRRADCVKAICRGFRSSKSGCAIRPCGAQATKSGITGRHITCGLVGGRCFFLLFNTCCCCCCCCCGWCCCCAPAVAMRRFGLQYGKLSALRPECMFCEGMYVLRCIRDGVPSLAISDLCTPCSVCIY